MILEQCCPLTAVNALQRAVTTAPEVDAIVAGDGRVTYGELAEEVARVSAGLRKLGVRKGDHVGICLGNSTLWVASFLAISSIGAVTVPVNTRFVASEMAYCLSQARVSTLIVASRFLNLDFVAMLREICPGLDTALPDSRLPDLRRVVVVGDDVPAAATGWNDFVTPGAPLELVDEASPDLPLLIQYTSGTTSFPKGVVLTHRNMLANAYFSGMRVGLRAADRFFSVRPFFHVAGSTLSVLSCLQCVSTLVTMDRFDAGAALRVMEDERCTHVAGNDTIALMLLSHPDRPSRKLALRGAWLAAAPTIVRRVMDELGAHEAVVGYGLSEASPNVAQSCWWEPPEVRASAAMAPQPGVEIRIVREDGGDAAASQPGEILVRGWNVMTSYFDKPEETKAALTADGWLRTGDLGSLGPDGRLTFLGRAKEIIRVGGENVSPMDVENVLHRHAGIRQAAVCAFPDERLIEVPVAFVILNDGADATPAQILDWAKGEMAGFKVPRRVWIVPSFEDIGMTASSKLQRKQLASHALKLASL